MEQVGNIIIDGHHSLAFNILRRFADALLIVLLLAATFLAMAPTPGHAHGIEEVVLYEENFNDNQAQDWELEQGWSVDAGMLCGKGHTWARYTGGRWGDARLTFKLESNGVHVNIRNSDTGRYAIGFREQDNFLFLYLFKQLWPDTFFNDLATKATRYSAREEHRVEISTTGGRIQVTVDGMLVIDYTDPSPLPPGTIAFETIDDTFAQVDDILVIGQPPAEAMWTLAGRVYGGEVGEETHTLQGVTVEVYGANNPYPDPGVLIAKSTTDEHGWYRLEVPAGYEFYSIRETDPPGYESVGATTVDGTVRTSNWIEYVISLEEKTLTGNKFWVKGPALPTPLLSVSPDPLSYRFDLTAGETSSREFSISNAGGGTLTWNVGTDQRGISVNPQSGTNSDTVTINIDTAGLNSGSYSGTITVTSNGGTMIGEIFLTIPSPTPIVTPTPILPPVVTPRPAPEEGPDLTISSTDYWFEDDGRVLVLFVEIANQGNVVAIETLVYAGDIEHDWLHEYGSVQALDPDEAIQVEIWLDIPEELRGTTRTFRVEVDPEDAVREIDEENNEAMTPRIPFQLLEEPPIEEPPEGELPLLKVFVTLGAIGGIIFTIRRIFEIQRRNEWQEKAKEEEPPETCQPCTRYCRKIELELEPALRKITYLSFGASDPVSGEQSKERQVKGELVDGLNKSVMAHRRREKPEKLQEQVALPAHTLLQKIMEWLRGESAPRDIFVTGHLEGGKVTCQFILYYCKRRGTVNVWEEDAKWKATIKDERDEFVGILRGMESTELGIPEQVVSNLTRLLIQFIERV